MVYVASVNVSSYKKLYLQTAKENCDALLKNCELLTNPSNTDSLRQIYISAHSLKSKSQVMGYSKIEELSGMIERGTRKILDEKKEVSEDLINTIKETAERIRALVTSER